MTKISIQDAAKQLGSEAEALMEGVAATRKSAQEAMLRLRQIEEGLRAQEQAALEERQKAREEEERLAAENAQEWAIKAALLGARGQGEGEEGQPEGQSPRAAAELDATAADPQVFEPEAPAERPPASETAAASQPIRPLAPRPAAPPQPGVPRPPRPGAYAPRPFIPNPNDPNALVNRQKAGQPPIDSRAPRPAGPGAPRPGGAPMGGRPAGPGAGGAPRPGAGRPGFGARSASKGPELTPTVEKERVSNYDPNKQNYQRQYDPERKQPKQKKAVMKETFAAAGGLDDEWRGGKRRPRRGQLSAQQMMQPIQVEKAYMTAETITVKDLSERIGKPAAEIIKKLFLLGIMATINQELDFDTAQLVCSEFGVEFELKIEKTYEETMLEVQEKQDDAGDLLPRPPVVTIMGHVDHGKTSLLDKIRLTNVTEGEAGGITQHIGAYTVEIHGQQITFLDTPGHEAFTAMRARGAQVTDIVILVVAADDGIMPQTIEAINHSKAAGVPIIVAINKMDRESANPERVKQELTEYNLVAEDWGGDTICVPVSAVTGQGIEQLLEMILLTSEMKELKANPNRPARGTIVEARLDRGRGPVATVLIQSGTIRVGDTIVAGTAYGRVRAMLNDKGEPVSSAGPSIPVELIGFSDVPEAGDTLNVADDDRLSRQVAEERRDRIKAQQLKAMSKATLEDLFNQIAQGQVKDLNIIVKADVQGSVEAVRQALEKLTNEEVRVRVIHGGVGAISESDIMLATVSGAIVVGFNVRPDAKAKENAEREKIDLRLYRVIYDAIDEIKAAMQGMLTPKFKETILGHAQVRQVFRVTGAGTIAGSYITDGLVRRNGQVRLLRDNIVVFEGRLSSLKRFKDDAREVASGYECGIGLENYNDLKENDVIECFVMDEIERPA
jgi:translation initiation factor IF-2